MTCDRFGKAEAPGKEGCWAQAAGDSPFLLQVNSEYYTGWLDYWGEAHASTSAAWVARGLEDMLQLGASVNMQVVSWQRALPPGVWASPLAFIPQGSGQQGLWMLEGRGLVSPFWVCGVADQALWGVS